MEQNRVTILLSSYNGAQFLEQQVASIRRQDYAALSVLVRDDGSTDATRTVLDKICSGLKGWSINRGNNRGVFGSFFELLASADETSGYFAFCDQDDIWLPGKISRAAAMLDKCGAAASTLPMLYLSRVEFMDRSERVRGESRLPRVVDFENAMVENIAMGCTMVINRAARKLLLSAVPQGLLLHDWWTYLTISAFGRIIFDPAVTLYRRVHSHNVTYDARSVYTQTLRRLHRLIKGDPPFILVSAQAEQFLKCFGPLLPARLRKKVSRLLAARKLPLAHRVLFALSHAFERQTFLDRVLFRIMIILNKY